MPNELPPSNDGQPPQNQDSSNPPSPPQFITADQFNAGLTKLAETFQESLRTIASARNTDPMVSQQPLTINLPSDQEVLEEIQAGGLSKLKQVVHGAVEKVKKEHIDPFQNVGMDILGKQAKQLAILGGEMPHYNRFKKEIDAAIQNLPPGQRISSEVYKGIHDLIVGQNFTLLERERQEAAVRAAREKDNTTVPSNAGGRQDTKNTDPNKIPSAVELYGEDAAAALGMLGKGGKTQDGFAQSMGYKDWADYYTVCIKPQQGATANG